MAKKLFTLKDVMPQNNYDSVSHRQKGQKSHGLKRDLQLLQRANNAWENLRGMREERERVLRYCYSDQWSDIIEWDGHRFTEREYIRRQGNTPLQNNIMISILNSIVGLYSKQGVEPVCFARTKDSQWLSDMMSATMQANWQNTQMPVVLKHVFEDGLCSGVHMVRETYEERDQEEDAYTDYCNPNLIFFEGGADPRHKDLNMVGVLHDISPEDLFHEFTREDVGLTIEKLREIFYINREEDTHGGNQLNERYQLDNVSFATPTDPRNVRVIEVWTKETKPRYQCYDPIAGDADSSFFRMEREDIDTVRKINLKRKSEYAAAGIPENERAYITATPIVDVYWHYTYLSPDGTVLTEGESPYEFHSHPFTLRLYPYVNGEIHPFMSNIIDQQRYINRLIVMHDMAAKSAAKGITIVPLDCVPDDMTPQDFADQFTMYDGLVFYNTARMNPNARPEIITSNGVQIGTQELLQMEMNLVRDITNVSGALQGKTPTSGTSASRYSMETQNATTSLYSVIADFTDFTEQLAAKKCAVIKQFYPDKKNVFNKDNTGILEYDKLSVEDVMFKISIRESAATAVYQMQSQGTLDRLLELGAIDVVQYLQNVNLPFADTLLQQVKAKQEEMMQQQALQQQALPANIEQ